LGKAIDETTDNVASEAKTNVADNILRFREVKRADGFDAISSQMLHYCPISKGANQSVAFAFKTILINFFPIKTKRHLRLSQMR
jgi:hypothetical protein